MNSLNQRPSARRDGIVVQETPNEILVFDIETNKAHCLNETSAFVWKACDGINSVADITEALGKQKGKIIDENLIWLAIDQLSENNLLAEKISTNVNSQTRREVIKKIGLAAVIALPIVSSLVAPTAALAATCSGANGSACVGNGNAGICCGGNCCEGQAFPCNGNVCG